MPAPTIRAHTHHRRHHVHELTIARPQRLGWLAGGALVSVLGAMLIAPAMNPVRAQDTDEPPGAHAERHRHRHRDRRARHRGHHRRRDRDSGTRPARPPQDAANVMDAVVTAIKALGIEDKDIQTTSLPLNPRLRLQQQHPPADRLPGHEPGHRHGP